MLIFSVWHGVVQLIDPICIYVYKHAFESIWLTNKKSKKNVYLRSNNIGVLSTSYATARYIVYILLRQAFMRRINNILQ